MKLRTLATCLYSGLALSGLIGLFALPGCRGPQTTVTVLGEELSTTGAVRALLGDYEKATGGKVRIKLVTEPYVKMDQMAMDDLANHTAVYDMILNYNTALSSYVRNKYVYTLPELQAQALLKDSEAVQKDLFPQAWREVGWYKDEGGTSEPVALPFAANTMVLCYNKQLFNDKTNKVAYEHQYHEPLTPPRTWQQFRNIAAFFSSRQPRGLVMQGDQYWIYFEWANFAYSMGGGVMRKQYGWDSDDRTPITLNTPENVTATSLYKQLKQFDASADFFKTDNYKQRDRMKEGDVAMAIMWSDMLYDFIKGPNPGQFDDRFGFTPIPGDKSMLAGGSFYINRNSKHAKEAADFMLWLLKPENQAKLLSKGLCSPLRSAYADPLVQRIPYRDAVRDSLERGVYMLEAGPDSDAIEVKMSEGLQRMFLQNASADRILRELQRDVEVVHHTIYDQLRQQEQRPPN